MIHQIITDYCGTCSNSGTFGYFFVSVLCVCLCLCVCVCVCGCVPTRHIFVLRSEINLSKPHLFVGYSFVKTE